MSSSDPIGRHAETVARAVLATLAQTPPEERAERLGAGLDAVRPGLAKEVLGRARVLSDLGHARPDALESAITNAIREVMQAEADRILGGLPPLRPPSGLGAAPPDSGMPVENDDVVRHNLIEADRAAWDARVYKGLWWPAYLTNIKDLTHEDVARALIFLGGKLNAEGCPQSDDALKKQAEDAGNIAKMVVNGVEAIAGVVASVILTAIWGPLAGTVTQLLHQGKMALVNELWKDTVIKDPQVQLAVAKLTPMGPYNFRGFRYFMRPYGNMLVQELGCKADLPTRLRLHGRMLRTIDVMVASARTASGAPVVNASGPNLYDYPSSFGPLKGSIFPPRGPASDGVSPGADAKKEADKAKQSLEAGAKKKPNHTRPGFESSPAQVLTNRSFLARPFPLPGAPAGAAQAPPAHTTGETPGASAPRGGSIEPPPAWGAPNEPRSAWRIPLPLIIGGAALGLFALISLATRERR